MERLKINNYKITAEDSLVEQMKESLHTCPKAMKYCKSIGMSEEDMDDNIIKIYDFVRDCNYCDKCPGLKKCTKENAYLITKVTFNNGVVETQLIPCKTLLKRVSFERQFIVKDFSDEWLDDTTSDISKTKEKKAALDKFSQYVKGEQTSWIYLTGGINSGKSYMAAIMAIDLAKRELKGKSPICFIDSPKRVLELNDLSKKNNDDFKKKLELYCTVPVLVIDDFGHEFVNDFIRDAIMNEIINTRCSKNLFTIFTSHYSLKEIEVLYSTSNRGSIIAKQMVKTIRTMCGGDEINLGDLPIYQ